jgi:hypothetical protein
VSPRFPAAAKNAFSIADREQAAALVAAVERWRAEMVAWVPGAVSPALAALLLVLLGGSDRPLPATPYRLSVYPRGGSLEQVMMWRAGLADMMLDVWDTLGPAPFDIAECNAVLATLMPEGTSASDTCPLCAGDAAPQATHHATCPVQLGWRAGRRSALR